MLLVVTKKNKFPQNAQYPASEKIISLQESWDWNVKDSKAARGEEGSEAIMGWHGHGVTSSHLGGSAIPAPPGRLSSLQEYLGMGLGGCRIWEHIHGQPGEPALIQTGFQRQLLCHPDSGRRERNFKVTLGPPGKQEHRRLSMCWGRAAERLWRERAKWIETC